MSDFHPDSTSDRDPVQDAYPPADTSPVARIEPHPGYPASSPMPTPAYAAPQQPQVGVMHTAGYTRPTANVAHVIIAWTFTVFTLGYFLPWAIAATRAKSNALPIALLNFFVGWTVIGWIAALVMACSSEPVLVNNIAVAVGTHPGYQQPTTAPPGWYPQGTGQRYWDGQRWTEHTAG